MRNLILLPLAALSACATPSSVMENAPAFTAKSSKSQTDLAACIARKWENFRGYRMNLIPGTDKTTVSLAADWGTEAFAEVYPDGRLQVRRRNAPIKSGNRPLIKAAEECV